MNVPAISSSELIERAKHFFPGEKVTLEPISPEHGSWRIAIGGREEARWIEFFWGPLSGFGATDVKNQSMDGPDIFAPYEVALGSAEEATQWLQAKAKKEHNQPAQTTPGLRPSVSDL